MQVDLQIDHCWLLLNRRAPPDTQAFKPTGYNAGRSLHCSPTLYNGEDCGIAYGLLVAGRMQSRCGDYWWGVSGVK